MGTMEGEQGNGQQEQQVLIKCAKGTRDWTPELMAVREQIFATITAIFRKHGAVGLDTPVFERTSTLMGKYGEDSKLIYDLADQGGERLSLRYDLTVPFARYVAENGITNITRYHIGKVYRRDNPAMTRGRFREFFQCDFDIAGAYDLMLPDAHCLKVVADVLNALPWLGPYTIKINHRRLLDGIFEYCGVPEDKFRTICSAVDKLDKLPWTEVCMEMVQKGISAEVAEKIGKYVQTRGSLEETLTFLSEQEAGFLENLGVQTAVNEMTLLSSYLEPLGIKSVISFDLSLARGLDYYTGLIVETVLQDGQVGSIVGGGRYDNLVGMFCGKQVPSVGVSIGIERILAAVQGKLNNARAKATKVVVCSIGTVSPTERFRIVNDLWSAGIAAEIVYRAEPKIRAQLAYASEIGAQFAVIIGDVELEHAVVQLKNLATKESSTLPLADAIEQIRKAE